jgi:hypothetical protein
MVVSNKTVALWNHGTSLEKGSILTNKTVEGYPGKRFYDHKHHRDVSPRR